MLKIFVFVFLAISQHLGDAVVLDNANSQQRLSQHEMDESFKSAYNKAVEEFSVFKYTARDAEYLNNYDKDDIYVTLYSRSSPHGHKIDVDLVQTVRNSSYDVKKMTKIIVSPIYVENFNSSEMVTAYLRHHKESVNVIAVNYRKFFGANFERYLQIHDYLTTTIAKLIEQLHRYGTLLDNVHVIGFGMSAHIVGGVAHMLHPYKVGRITGLEPTGGMFDQHKWLGLLTADDAEYVDVIMTNTRKYGTKKERGTVHFYPNGGESQPESDDFTSHLKALAYFVESIVGTHAFPAENANSWADYKAGHTLGHSTYMGEYASKDARGKFYLNVNPTLPYSKTGEYGNEPYSKTGEYGNELKDQTPFVRNRVFGMAQKAWTMGDKAFMEENQISGEIDAYNAEDKPGARLSGRRGHGFVKQKSN